LTFEVLFFFEVAGEVSFELLAVFAGVELHESRRTHFEDLSLNNLYASGWEFAV
jgi:hypothetical protein